MARTRGRYGIDPTSERSAARKTASAQPLTCRYHREDDQQARHLRLVMPIAANMDPPGPGTRGDLGRGPTYRSGSCVNGLRAVDDMAERRQRGAVGGSSASSKAPAALRSAPIASRQAPAQVDTRKT